MKLMAWWLALVTCALLLGSEETAGVILGFPPPTSTCLCSAGDRVAARDGPCLKNCTTLVRLYRGDCFRFRGSVRTADGYRWFQLENVDGLNLWTVGKYLTVGQDSQCSRGCPGSQQQACRVLNRHLLGQITLSDSHAQTAQDSATAYDNVADTCHGKRAKRSRFQCITYAAPGGDTCLDARVTNYLLHVRKGSQVAEIAGGCNRNATSPSYLGRGVTLAKDDRATRNRKVCQNLGGTMEDDGNFLYCHFPQI